MGVEFKNSSENKKIDLSQEIQELNDLYGTVNNQNHSNQEINKKLDSLDSMQKSSIDKLLNKPNMTETDKKNMKKSVELLKANKMLTPENLKKLEAINYAVDHIEIWWVKRTRKNLNAEPNGKTIFKYWNNVYFKYRALDIQNKLLKTKRMRIPGKSDFVKSLATLPWYIQGSEVNSPQSNVNILWTILNLPAGSVNGFGKLALKDDDGSSFREIWSITPSSEPIDGSDMAYKYREEETGSVVMSELKGIGTPIRPILMTEEEVKLPTDPAILYQENLKKLEANENNSLINKLLSKPNMTETDKKNMKKSVELLKANKTFTQENLKKLEAINYAVDHIEIWWVKRTRKNLNAEPNGKTIFKYWDNVYFKYRALDAQNKLLKTRWMRIPAKSDFIKSLAALPWYTQRGSQSPQSDVKILWTILNLPMAGSVNGLGKLSLKDDNGSSFREIWSLTPSSEERDGPDKAYKYREEKIGWTIMAQHKWFGMPIRPIIE